MAKPTIAIGFRVAPDVEAALKCLCIIYGKTQQQIFSTLILKVHASALAKFTPLERARYIDGLMSQAEFTEILYRRDAEIRRRSMKGAGEHAPTERPAMVGPLGVAAPEREDAA